MEESKDVSLEINKNLRIFIGGLLMGSVLDFRSVVFCLFIIWALYKGYSPNDIRKGLLGLIKNVKNELTK